MLSFFGVLFAENRQISAISPRKTITVVIDAGHGGVDGGVVGTNTGVLEREINLLMAKELKKQLENAGFNAVMTRTTKYALYDEAKGGFKREDFERRKRIIEESNATLVVSLHCNKFSDRSRRGAQVFYDCDNESSKAYAKELQSVINETVNAKYAGRAFSALSGDYYILKCTTVPSVIIECGFLSNAEDERLLNDEAFRAELSYQIMTGTIRYLMIK
jgi:N-acetylmuramoyl-L-alanine amidase